MPISGKNGHGPKQLILYDLDGTLADTREDITRAANHMRGQMGLGPLPRAEVCRFVGLGLRQLVQNCLETEDSARVDQGITLYRAHYSAHLLDHTVLYPSVQEVLDHFRARAQAVVTNKPDPYSRDILEKLGVAGYFLKIVAGNSGYAKKPDPAGIRAIMRKAGADPARTLLVGDSPIDVQTGAQAGIATVGVTQGFCARAELEAAGPDELVENFGELLKLARNRGW